MSSYSQTDTSTIKDPSKTRIMVDAGFGHWTSDRFRTAVLGRDLGFGITVNPGLSFLQLQARYDFSTIRTTPGDTIFSHYNGRHIGFTNLNVAVCKAFQHKSQTLIVSYSAGAVFVNIEDETMVSGISGGFSFNYLFGQPTWNRFAPGISLSVITRTYNITGEETTIKEWVTPQKENIERDVNITLGVVFAF